MNLYAVTLVVCLLAGQSPDYSHRIQEARLEYLNGHFAASEKLFSEALQMLEPGDQTQRASTLTELGDVYVSEYRVAEAETIYLEVLALYTALADNRNIVLILRDLGAAYSLDGRDEDAFRLLNRALKLGKTLPPEDAEIVSELFNVFGMIYYRQGNIGKASEMFNKALKASFETPQLLSNLGAVYIVQHKFQKAEETLKHALKLAEGRFGSSHPELTFVLQSLGVLYTDWGRYQDAEDQYVRALKILDDHKPEFDTRTARVLHLLSGAYAKAGRKSESDTALANAAVIARRSVGRHPDMVTILEDYSATLNNQGHTKEADELRTEARRARISAGLVIKAHNP
jgi:tetratricopeptide (TPR) repeat protein